VSESVRSMTSASRLVAADERIHLVTREHGVVLLRPFLRAALAIGLFGGGAYEVSGSPAPGPVRWAAAVLALVVVTISMTGLVRRVLRWHTRRLVVTDHRAILVAGFLRRRIASVSLDGISDLSIGMSGPGRVLRYGTVQIAANGRRGALFGLRRLPDPDLVMALLLGLSEPPRGHGSRHERGRREAELSASQH
jgi:hypothetical protein